MVEKKELIKDEDLGIACDSKVNRKLVQVLRRVAGIDQLNHIYNWHSESRGVDFAREVLDYQFIERLVSETSLANIPVHGGCVVVANCPHGGLDGLLLIELLASKRDDVKFLGNFIFAKIEPLSHFFIEVNPFNSNSSVNLNGIRAAREHVVNGGMLVVFPSNSVATIDSVFGRAQEGEWQKSTMKFVQNCKVPILPIYISGSNSRLFHLLGKVHPMLRMAQLPREFVRTRNQQIDIEVASPMTIGAQLRLKSLENFSDFLRANTLLLAERLNKGGDGHKNSSARAIELELQSTVGQMAKVMRNISPKRLTKFSRSAVKTANEVRDKGVDSDTQVSEAEFERHLNFKDIDYSSLKQTLLPYLVQEAIGGGLQLYFVDASDVPLSVIVGRDSHVSGERKYCHYIVMTDDAARCITMCYELVMGSELMSEGAVIEGFRAYDKFEFSRKLNDILASSIEITGLYVNDDYAERSDTLKMLWSGIMTIAEQQSWCKHLIGVVRVAPDFSPVAKLLIISYLKYNGWDSKLSKFVTPRYGVLKGQVEREVAEIVDLASQSPSNELIEKLLVDLVPDKGREKESYDRSIERLPMMLKRYLYLGGSVVSFNVDSSQGEALDVLLLLNLERS